MSVLDSIPQKVQTLVKKYDTRDPFELCRKLRIGVKYRELCPQLKAYFFYQSRIKTVVLNSQTDAVVHRILCAHELGHATLHAEKLVAMRGFRELELFDCSDRTEYEANIFAAELLIPDGELLEILNTEDCSFFQAASALYVPVELLDFKFRVLKSKGYKIEAPFLAQSDFLKHPIEGLCVES